MAAIVTAGESAERRERAVYRRPGTRVAYRRAGTGRRLFAYTRQP
jgi:hypothetical protein